MPADFRTLQMVGLGGLEPPTSSLSGMRSSHLSYRPRRLATWWSWSGSNRRPPECKSGALPAELQPRFSSEADWTQRPENSVFRSQGKPQNSKWRSETRLSESTEVSPEVYGVERLPMLFTLTPP